MDEPTKTETPPLHIAPARAYTQGRFAECLAECERILGHEPDNPDVRMLLGEVQLLYGNYQEGFANYEARCATAGFDAYRRSFPQPWWKGEPLGNRTLVIGPEQSVGEVLQFCRYAPILAKQASDARVVLEVPGRLARLLQQSFEGISNLMILPTQDRAGSNLPSFDLYLPVVSLPARARTTLATVPGWAGYLKSPAKRLTEKGELTIGISWNSQAVGSGAIRSLSLQELARHLQLPGVRLINLQYGDSRAAQEELLHREGLSLRNSKGLSLESDMTEIAALAQGCDLVVTIDNTTAHIAGALGRPTFVLLPSVPTWRWLLERSDSPWYPTMRLFRQPTAGDWGAVLPQVTDALRELMAAFHKKSAA